MGRINSAIHADRCTALLAVSLLAVGCASTSGSFTPGDPRSGVTHVLRPGENLYRLSRYYDVSVNVIARVNGIRDVTRLQVGQKIWIPGAHRQPPRGSLAQDGVASNALRRGDGPKLVWPVRGQPSSRFGQRNGRKHEGIDIPAKRGTPVRAAAAGRVIHSGGGLGDYGKVVILKHVGRYSTVYAHNQRNRVKKGDFVEQGDVIGEVGTTGNATGPHVHFEVRRDRTPQDPLLYLP